jgi:hypothetical protein
MIFPNESQEYRDARDALLRQEVELMRQLEAVTAQHLHNYRRPTGEPTSQTRRGWLSFHQAARPTRKVA